MPLELCRRKGSRNWYLRGTVLEQSIFETSGTPDRRQAEIIRTKREAELFDQAVFGKRAVVTFEHAALSYLEFEERAARTKVFVKKLVGHFKQTRLAKIGQDEADDAARKICGTDSAPSTKRRAVYGPLNAILMHAHHRKWCDAPKFAMPSPPKGRTRWLTPDEASRLINAASENALHLRPLLMFYLCTGARASEALDLLWDDVDLAAEVAVFRDTKNGSERPASLNSAAIIALANLGNGKGIVFRRDDGKPYADKNREEGGQFKTAFKTACRIAGLSKAEAAGQGYRDGPYSKVHWRPTLTPHDLRHTWATWFYAITKDFMLLKTEGGWDSIRSVERYAHLMPSELVGEIRQVWGSRYPALGRPVPSPKKNKISAVRSQN
jgi:integrase